MSNKTKIVIASFCMYLVGAAGSFLLNWKTGYYLNANTLPNIVCGGVLAQMIFLIKYSIYYYYKKNEYSKRNIKIFMTCFIIYTIGVSIAFFAHWYVGIGITLLSFIYISVSGSLLLITSIIIYLIFNTKTEQ